MRGLAWWHENGGRFSRLPLRAEGVVREIVWTLAQQPAGARIVFCTDSPRLHLRMTNTDVGTHATMSAMGSSGVSLYCGEPYRQRYWSSYVPQPPETTLTCAMFENVPRKMREFTLYLPPYQALKEIEIGIEPGVAIEPPSAHALDKPVVFYGTSITQGGCASTAGAHFVPTVGRLLNLDMVDLGFSGNGQGEPEVAEFISEIDAALFVLDYVGNVDQAGLSATLPRFIEVLRARHPQTPIALASCITFSWAAYDDIWLERLEETRDIMMGIYLDCRRAGDRNVHFIDGSMLLPFGTDGAFADSVHPTDHGFAMMAERIAPIIERIVLR